MLKNLLFLVLVVGSVVAARQWFDRPPERRQTQQAVQAASSPTSGTVLFQEKNGIDVTVTDVEQTDATTVVAVQMNNHRYDLTKKAIYQGATLDGRKSLSHVIPSDAVGGHHVEVSIVFPRTTQGPFVITPADGIIFTFDDVWR